MEYRESAINQAWTDEWKIELLRVMVRSGASSNGQWEIISP
jgi:hypothetical protein